MQAICQPVQRIVFRGVRPIEDRLHDDAHIARNVRPVSFERRRRLTFRRIVERKVRQRRLVSRKRRQVYAAIVGVAERECRVQRARNRHYQATA